MHGIVQECVCGLQIGLTCVCETVGVAVAGDAHFVARETAAGSFRTDRGALSSQTGRTGNNAHFDVVLIDFDINETIVSVRLTRVSVLIAVDLSAWQITGSTG